MSIATANTTTAPGCTGRLAPSPTPGRRLDRRTRRLRALLLLAAFLSVLALGWGMASAAAGQPQAEAAEPVRYEQLTVRLDDSLWSIAESVAGEREVPEVMEEIMRLNGMSSRIVHPGQVLL
ncbi:MAG: LysM peptidoglycan-binding domain-containing protein, partial [Pseudoclavibacter sp.]|nr:LysM peptidoglycan-binding domain-containing protein [Pseudoclavibacter sp.]